jgi:hypothetical protein
MLSQMFSFPQVSKQNQYSLNFPSIQSKLQVQSILPTLP